MKHYVYRITNKLLNKHYYGARSAEHPSLDIGIKYFSSSSDSEFIRDQKIYPDNYKYKVISIYDTRIKAINKEILLHAKFNVGVNSSFYNKVKQTSAGFDSTGSSPVISDIQKAIISETHKGKVLSESTRAKISANHADVSGSNNPMFGKSALKGYVAVINKTTGIKGLLFKEEFTNRPSNIVSIASITKRTLKILVCPYCLYEGKGGNMTRYHFDNCKIKRNCSD